MMPEKTAIAAKDVKAKVIMPIHWGAFTLAMHAWTDPIVRVKNKADELNIPLIAHMVGEYVNTIEDELMAKGGHVLEKKHGGSSHYVFIFAENILYENFNFRFSTWIICCM